LGVFAPACAASNAAGSCRQVTHAQAFLEVLIAPAHNYLSSLPKAKKALSRIKNRLFQHPETEGFQDGNEG